MTWRGSRAFPLHFCARTLPKSLRHQPTPTMTHSRAPMECTKPRLVIGNDPPARHMDHGRTVYRPVPMALGGRLARPDAALNGTGWRYHFAPEAHRGRQVRPARAAYVPGMAAHPAAAGGQPASGAGGAAVRVTPTVADSRQRARGSLRWLASLVPAFPWGTCINPGHGQTLSASKRQFQRVRPATAHQSHPRGVATPPPPVLAEQERGSRRRHNSPRAGAVCASRGLFVRNRT